MRFIVAILFVLTIVLTLLLYAAFDRNVQHKLIRPGLLAVRDGCDLAIQKLDDTEKPARSHSSPRDAAQARIGAALAQLQQSEQQAADVQRQLDQATGQLRDLFRNDPAPTTDDPRAVNLASRIVQLKGRLGDLRNVVSNAKITYESCLGELHALETGQALDIATPGSALNRQRAAMQGAPVVQEASRAVQVEKELATATAEAEAAKRKANDAISAKREAEQAAADTAAKLAEEKRQREAAEKTAAEAVQKLAASEAATATPKRHWVPETVQRVLKKDWVAAHMETQTSQVYVEPEYQTVTKNVWREPTTLEAFVDIPEHWEYRDVLVYGCRGSSYIARQTRYVYAHREKRLKTLPGYWEDVTDKKLVRAGGYHTIERQINVPGRYEAHWVDQKIEGHWESEDNTP